MAISLGMSTRLPFGSTLLIAGRKDGVLVGVEVLVGVLVKVGVGVDVGVVLE